ncbi:hypothetical protein B0J14DRAFT_317586 [Halenospora varia]|nr:hypothetical protein B0J14DRAFT_317586 [Halenospora varia]
MEESQPAPLTSFHLFPLLAPEIRAKIWALTLPAPRVILIEPEINKPPVNPDVWTYTKRAYMFQGHSKTYIASIKSYGGSHPTLLSVCRESRGEALSHLTLKFKAYWNMKQDIPYVEVKRFGWMEAMEMVQDMRTKGLLDDFDKLALDVDIVKANEPEHIVTTLRLLPNVSNLYFILRSRDHHQDVVDPGVSWTLLEVESPDQSEFEGHQSWCPLTQVLRGPLQDRVKQDVKDHPTAWRERKGCQPVIEVRLVGNRKMLELPTGPSYYEPPWEDWFG